MPSVTESDPGDTSAPATKDALRNGGKFPCRQCGADVAFKPGTTTLVCPYCTTVNEIDAGITLVEEIDYESQLRAMEKAERDVVEKLEIACHACHARVQFPPNVTSFGCPFCGRAIVATGTSVKQVKPHAVLPFKIDSRGARERLRTWVKSLWFAPSDLKRFAETERVGGIYLPFWTYDCAAVTDYTGLRGDHYYETQMVPQTVNGRTQMVPRQVQRTRWSPASGRVNNTFDDVLVCASGSMSAKESHTLEPWDLKALVPYADDYLAGFKAESYQTGLKEGFEQAKAIMRPTIETTIRHDIGGNVQQIDRMQSLYSRITFKHALLPVWIMAYSFGTKLFRVLVNARTGEVIGQRPYSAWKIAMVVIAGVIVLAIVAVVIGVRR